VTITAARTVCRRTRTSGSRRKDRRPKSTSWVNGSDLLGTPSGFKAGSDLGELKPAYGTAGEELNYKTKAGYLVKAPSGNGMLFDLDVSTKKVRDVIAGNARLSEGELPL
jgi:hypothetical protein